eukprot:scaffold17633_cov65-Phaeocystis_antarctica.AAC.2
MPIAKGFASHLQRLAAQQLSGGEVALFLQQRAEVADGAERVRMPIAEGLAQHLQRLTVQRLSGGEVALGLQQVPKVVDRDERVWMPIIEHLAPHPQSLAEQRLSLVALALVLQLCSEGVQGAADALTIRALGLEPCTQQLDAQRIAVMVHALAAAVGCILLWALASPFLDAVVVGPLGGAAAGARLHERAVVFSPEAHTALQLLLYHSGVRLWSRVTLQNELSASPRAARLARRTAGHGFAAEPARPPAAARRAARWRLRARATRECDHVAPGRARKRTMGG